MILDGRGVSRGSASGKVVKVDESVSFLGDVEPRGGVVFGEKDITDSIFVFPSGKGSTVGSYVIYQLKKNGTGPRGMVNRISETIVAAGAIISEIPLIDKIDIDILRDGDEVKIDGENGQLEVLDVKSEEVVTAFLRKKDKVLLLRRSDQVGSFQGKWSGVSGYLETDAKEQAMIEIEQETGLDASFVSSGETVLARGEGTIWKVHPFIFDARGELELNWENMEHRWVKSEKMKKMETVPKLWEAYDSAEKKG